MRDLAEKTSKYYLFFNNHYQGKSAQNAKMFANMLDLPLPELNRPPHTGTLGL